MRYESLSENNYEEEIGNIMVHIFFSAASSLPIQDIVHWAHAVEAKVLVDACQSVPHMPVDVRDLDADFLVASSHKVSLLPYTMKYKL